MPRFTFTDVIVATVLVAFSVAVIVPTAVDKKEEANRLECARHLHMIGRAVILYANENKGSFPRAMADTQKDTINFFTNPNIAKVGDDKAVDADPFTDKGPAVNDITAAMFLLLRTQPLDAQAFLCPSVSGDVASLVRGEEKPLRLPGEPELNPLKMTNFAGPKYLNYSFVNVYPKPDAIAKGYKTFVKGFRGQFALAADLNSGAAQLKTLTAQSPAVDLKAANSPNHNGDGQNVLYADGRVEFRKTPLCGENLGRDNDLPDNIYTFGVNTDKTGGDGVLGFPVDNADSVLLPSAVEMKAAEPKEAK